MTRLALICALSFALAWALCYGAMRTAQSIARKQLTQQQQIESTIDQ